MNENQIEVSIVRGNSFTLRGRSKKNETPYEDAKKIFIFLISTISSSTYDNIFNMMKFWSEHDIIEDEIDADNFFEYYDVEDEE